MKIIQSFAQWDEGSFYKKRDDNDNNNYLNFYSFLLSVLTLQKYYNHVEMYCNDLAYDTFIKYIPYDKIIHLENKHTKQNEYWNQYKIDVMRLMSEKFIHVDSDVFIFDDIYSDFIMSDKYDVIIQDTIPESRNFVKNFVYRNEDFLNKNDIVDPIKYDGRCVSCGTVGMTPEVKKEYIEKIDIFLKAYEDKMLVDYEPFTMVSEELLLYLLILNNGLSVFDVIPHDEILRIGVEKAGENRRYTHMWFNNKYRIDYVRLIKNKILRDFPEQHHVVHKYEDEVISKIGVKI